MGQCFQPVCGNIQTLMLLAESGTKPDRLEALSHYQLLRQPDLLGLRLWLGTPSCGAVHGGAHFGEPPLSAFNACLLAAHKSCVRITVEAEFQLPTNVHIVVHNAASLAEGVGQSWGRGKKSRKAKRSRASGGDLRGAWRDFGYLQHSQPWVRTSQINQPARVGEYPSSYSLRGSCSWRMC
jgi:hypothetical protein